MKKIIDWFKESHRWQHFLGGVAIGLGSPDTYCAAYTGIGVAGALEFKDMKYDGKWDWIDFSITLAGVAVGFGARMLFKTYVS